IVPLQYLFFSSFFFNDPLPPEIYTLSLHDALPISELNAKHWSWLSVEYHARQHSTTGRVPREHWLAELPFLRTLPRQKNFGDVRSEEHTSELQSQSNLVCRLLLEKKKTKHKLIHTK